MAESAMEPEAMLLHCAICLLDPRTKGTKLKISGFEKKNIFNGFKALVKVIHQQHTYAEF